MTNICLVHRYRGGLPHKRARLYQECIDILLEHWHGAIGLKPTVTAEEGSRSLQPAALWLHLKEGRTMARADELAPHIAPVLKSVGWEKGSAEDFLRMVRDESGLLTGWSDDQYGFMHLGFQEYLAAREIRSRAFREDDQAVIGELASHFGESWWQEVILLLLALKDPSLFGPFMEEVIKLPLFCQHPAFLQSCLDDAAEVTMQPFKEVLEIKPGKDEGLWERQLAALKILKQRDKDLLYKLKPVLSGHPSRKIKRLINNLDAQAYQDVITVEEAEYELVKIPGGTFMMGSPESEKDRLTYEGPLHRVNVADFYIGRYPVTNKEYARFLEANPDVQEPKYWADRRFNQTSQPVVGVSWNDVKQYAKWTGLRLPTEAEWEYACRAGTQTMYYSGNTEKDLDRAGWYYQNSGEQTHPVGQKEPNNFGLYDMHGNVWEWVEDDWHKNYDGAPDDGTAWIDKPRGSGRVIRGGSWGGLALYCRSAIRDDDHPVERNVRIDKGTIIIFMIFRRSPA